MEKIKFDFNNMFDFNIGHQHGITYQDIESFSSVIEKAKKHFKKIISTQESRIKLGLEWIKLPYQDKKTVNEIQKFGKEISLEFENVLFLGIGGSYLGLKAAQDALCSPYYNEFPTARRKTPKIYFEGNNLDPTTLSVLIKNLNPKKTFVVVISKSGETIETKIAFNIVSKWLKRSVGKNYARHIFVITDPTSGSLRKFIEEYQKKDKLSFRNQPLLKGVGGRYSELNIGLLHFAIVGVEIQEILNGAKYMSEICQESSLYRNPAYMYAVLQTILYLKKNKYISVIMPFSEGLKSTADWYVQLLAESLGKKYSRKIIINNNIEEWIEDKHHIVNVGRTPISARGTNDLHSIQQNNVHGMNNKTITFIKILNFKNNIIISDTGDFIAKQKYSDLINLAQEATEWACVREKRPNCTIILPELNPYTWAQLIFFFEVATAFEGELLNVNAFDQPGVESYKNYMYYKLGKKGISEEIEKEIKSYPLIKKQKLII